MGILINGGTNDILIDGESVATDAEVTAQIGAIPVVDDASETVKGIIEIATNAEVQTGTDTIKAVTPAGLLSAVIGLGQTWQVVTRVSGTTYTNSTGKPIMASMFSSVGNCTTIVNGVNVAATGQYGTTVIIPNGATYSFTGTVSGVSELR